ncbi:MAG TPA: methylamine utilization protein [Aromatoleum sp.]|uniref:methylamine utilization protein n=1 Tax=Aromatoleum sp. TaxID=2307007 RepID=UPI002B45FF8F|nr:methylamine utilization protein [Aromatoleum sp.]HJV28165.1 methylamine utilization protein [Aromatoleum sp.]
MRASCAWVALLSSLGAGELLAGDIQAKVRDKTGKGVADAVIVALPATPMPAATGGPVSSMVVDQINKEFVPYVLPIQVGSSVNFPNRDNIRHHVYSFSPAKTFELPLYTGTPATPVLFEKPGVVILGCNIHDWMIGYIYVSESPYFAKTGADGKAVLADLPQGEYVVRAWHPRLEGREEATERKLTVTRSGATESVWEIGLLADLRIRRAPIPGQSGYH